MSFWGVRAGSHGEMEEFALSNNVVIIGYGEYGDVNLFSSIETLKDQLGKIRPKETSRTLSIWSGQIWSFVHNIKIGDLVALPRKGTGQIAFGEVIGPYRFDASAVEGAQQQRPVKWLDVSFARTRLDEDILNSLGSLLTVFRVKAHDAEHRVRQALAGKTVTAPTQVSSLSVETSVDPDALGVDDLERKARDRINEFIRRKFTDHRLEELVEAVLQAQGFFTDRTPPGPDGGVDILAARGPLGIEAPRIAVQVKSSSTPSDVAQVRALKGVLDDFGADFGLFVSWSGFRGIATTDSRRDFFQMRLWNAEVLLDEILANYDKLPSDIQAELPLKRVWMLAEENAV